MPGPSHGRGALSTADTILKKASALVPRLEELERRSPRWFRVRVALLILTNYSVILGIVSIFIGVGLIAIYNFWEYGPTVPTGFGWGAIVGAWILIDALWVTLPDPTGLVLPKEAAPKLYALMEGVRSEAGAPPVRAIRLQNVCNAAIFSTYRYALFGPTTTELIIGFPLLLILSPEELRLILRHEFDHTRRGQGHFMIWAFRVFQSWSQYPLQERDLQPGARVIVHYFALWFLPRLRAYSAVLSRAQEIAADRYAAGEAQAQAKAHVLVKLALAEWFLTLHFWPGVWAGASTKPEPPGDAMERMREELIELPRGVQDALMEIPFNEEQRDDPLSSHPPPRDRLAALGVAATLEFWQPALPEGGLAPSPSAAEEYLGSSKEEWSRKISAQWKRDQAFNWDRQFAHFERYRDSQRDLDEKGKPRPLTPEELWNRSEAAFALSGAKAAEPDLRAVLQLEPDHAKANYQLGSILLSRDDRSGVALVEKAMALDPSRREIGPFLIAGFMERQGRKSESEEYLKAKSEERAQELTIARARRQVLLDDKFSPHGLEPERVKAIAEGLARLSEVTHAFLVQKELPIVKDKPFYVLAVSLEPMKSQSGLNEALAVHARLERLADLPSERNIILMDSSQSSLERMFRSIPESEVFNRTRVPKGGAA